MKTSKPFHPPATGDKPPPGMTSIIFPYVPRAQKTRYVKAATLCGQPLIEFLMDCVDIACDKIESAKKPAAPASGCPHCRELQARVTALEQELDGFAEKRLLAAVEKVAKT